MYGGAGDRAHVTSFCTSDVETWTTGARGEGNKGHRAVVCLEKGGGEGRGTVMIVFLCRNVWCKQGLHRSQSPHEHTQKKRRFRCHTVEEESI